MVNATTGSAFSSASSLARLRAHLEQLGVQVGQSTLSYWQRGLRHPEVPRAISTVRALESVLRCALLNTDAIGQAGLRKWEWSLDRCR